MWPLRFSSISFCSLLFCLHPFLPAFSDFIFIMMFSHHLWVAGSRLPYSLLLIPASLWLSFFGFFPLIHHMPLASIMLTSRLSLAILTLLLHRSQVPRKELLCPTNELLYPTTLLRHSYFSQTDRYRNTSSLNVFLILVLLPKFTIVPISNMYHSNVVIHTYNSRTV